MLPELIEEFEDQTGLPEKGIYSTSKNVQSGVFYEARATIETVPDRFRTYTPWLTTSTKTSRDTVYLPGVVDDIIQNLQGNLKWLAESVHYSRDELDRLNQLAADTGAQSANHNFELLASMGQLDAKYTQEIEDCHCNRSRGRGNTGRTTYCHAEWRFHFC